MENEQLQVPPPSSSTRSTSTASSTSSSSSNGRQSGPQISVYSGIPDRQTVQVIQQALHRQPSTAAQYLQQMYAAQQQHLSSAQLQSLAAVQQASLAANRQGGSSGNAPPQTPSQQPTINLAPSPAAAQLINRAQSVNSAAASGIAQQAVLLGNATSPALTASQAQMYLRAQMLIFTPTATVTAVQPEGSGAPTSQPSTLQVQNLALRAQQTVAQGMAASQAQQLPALAMKPAPSSSQPVSSTSQGKAAGPAPAAGTKGSQAEQAAEHLKKGDGSMPTSADCRGHPMSRTVTPVTTHPLIAPVYAQILAHLSLPLPSTVVLKLGFGAGWPHPQQWVPLPRAGPWPLEQREPRPPPPPPTPSLAVQPSPQAQGQLQSHAAPQGPAPLPHPPQCQASSQHKPGANQPSLQVSGLQAMGPAQPVPEGGPQNGHPGDLTHAPQRKFQHASAVILQLQPALGTALCIPPPWAILARPAEKGGDPRLTTSAPHSSGIPREGPGGAPVPLGRAQSPLLPAEPGQDCVHVQNDPSSPGMTSGNGNSASTVAGTAPQNGENKPPQAIVKPQVLTHVIEGFVIQEGAEPFPVGRSSLLVGNLKKKYAQGLLAEKLPQQDNTTTTDSEMEEPYLQGEADEQGAEEQLCQGSSDLQIVAWGLSALALTRSWLPGRYNVGCTKRVGLFHPDRSKLQKPGGAAHGRRRACKAALPVLSKDRDHGPSPPLAPGPGLGPAVSPPSVALGPVPRPCCGGGAWRGNKVEGTGPSSPSSAAATSGVGHRRYSRVGPERTSRAGLGPRSRPGWLLAGCQEIAEEFRAQEIDGQALLLLKEDHLMSAMNIKLGPALKIYARISMLKDS
uniref:Polyhomeotic homolog 2 n=1 Tax=Pelodiscus sinensis TaxID=13735 RepID=K7G465_PELSI